MKVYVNDNHDGRTSTMVAAGTLREAALKLGTTANAMRTYGWSLAEGEDRDLALSRPDTVFSRPFSGKGPWTPKGPARLPPLPAPDARATPEGPDPKVDEEVPTPLESAARLLYAQGRLAESDAVSDAAARLAVFDASLAPGGGLPETVVAAILRECTNPRICSVRGRVTRELRCGPCERKALHTLLERRQAPPSAT